MKFATLHSTFSLFKDSKVINATLTSYHLSPLSPLINRYMSVIFLSQAGNDSGKLNKFLPELKAPYRTVNREWYPHWEKGKLREKVAVNQRVDESNKVRADLDARMWVPVSIPATGGSRLYDSHTSLFHSYTLPYLPLATHFQPIVVPHFWHPYIQSFTQNPQIFLPEPLSTPTPPHVSPLQYLSGLYNQFQGPPTSVAFWRAAFPVVRDSQASDDQQLHSDNEETESCFDSEWDPQGHQCLCDTPKQEVEIDFIDEIVKSLSKRSSDRSQIDKGDDSCYEGKNQPSCSCAHNKHYVRAAVRSDDTEDSEDEELLEPHDTQDCYQTDAHFGHTPLTHRDHSNFELANGSNTSLSGDTSSLDSHFYSDPHLEWPSLDERIFKGTDILKYAEAEKNSLRWRGRERTPRTPFREVDHQNHDQSLNKYDSTYFPLTEIKETKGSRGRINSTRHHLSSFSGSNHDSSHPTARGDSCEPSQQIIISVVDDGINHHVPPKKKEIKLRRGRSDTVRRVGDINKSEVEVSSTASSIESKVEPRNASFIRRLSSQFRPLDKGKEKEAKESLPPSSLLTPPDANQEMNKEKSKRGLLKRFKARVQDI